MSRVYGPPEAPPEQREQVAASPGSFVSAELQSDCARFLEQLHDTIKRRLEAEIASSR